jgi:hypothetical protein
MPITGTKPLVVPTGNPNYWLTGFQIRSATPGEPKRLSVSLHPYMTIDGKDALAPVQPVTLSIGDLDTEAKADPELAAMIALVEAKVRNLAVAKGLI